MTYIERLEVEEKELQNKLAKLIAFIKSDKIEELPTEKIVLLGEQCQIMGDYHRVLCKRLDLEIN